MPTTPTSTIAVEENKSATDLFASGPPPALSSTAPIAEETALIESTEEVKQETKSFVNNVAPGITALSKDQQALVKNCLLVGNLEAAVDTYVL